MIDIEKGKKLFTKYVDNYNMNNEKINLKYYHTLRVMDFCKNIAESLELDNDDIEISMLIGLLHDIGRFEQIKVFDTFVDKDSIDHADFAVYILKNNDYISKYVENKDIQDIVLKAIKYHNKSEIKQDLSEREKLFCKIIRDADKLDIFDLLINNNLKIDHTDDTISPNIYKTLINRKLLLDADITTEMDHYLRNVGMFFDLNFKYSTNLCEKKQLHNKIIDLIIKKNQHEKKKLNEIKIALNDYFNTMK